MSEYIYFITLISIFIYIFGLFSLFIRERLFISEAIIATCYGILIRKLILPMLNPEFMKELSRVILSLQVVAVGITVPNTYVRNEWFSLFMLLVPIMFLSFIASSIVIKFVGNIDWFTATIVGACVTPTDPVLATAVLKGNFADKYIPAHLRNLLTIESGANDGLGYILLTLPFLLHNRHLTNWILRNWIWEVIVSIIFGGIIGYSARKVFNLCKGKNFIDKESHLGSLIALGLFSTGFCCLMKSDDILSCFVCGFIFSWDPKYKEDIRNSHLLEVLDLYTNNTFFICFGATLTFDIFRWRYICIAILIILVRRLPFFYLLKRFVPQLKNSREVFFAGWFGPVGVGAVFFCHHAVEHMKSENIKSAIKIFPLVQLIVLASIFVHGLTAPIIHFHLKNKKMEEEVESSYSRMSV